MLLVGFSGGDSSFEDIRGSEVSKRFDFSLMVLREQESRGAKMEPATVLNELNLNNERELAARLYETEASLSPQSETERRSGTALLPKSSAYYSLRCWIVLGCPISFFPFFDTK